MRLILVYTNTNGTYLVEVVLDYHNWDFWGPKIWLAVEMQPSLFLFWFLYKKCYLENFFRSMENKGETCGYFNLRRESYLAY